MGMVGRRLVVAAAMLLACVSAQAAPTRQQVEAALVYKFVQFVQWPEDMQDTNAPIVVGLLGSENLRSELEGVLKTKRLRGRSFEVRVFDAPERVRDCQVLVFDLSAERHGSSSGALPRKGLLTIGEGSDFVRHGGVIAVILEGDHVGFELNLAAAESAQLTLDPALLGLAREAGRW
jgi:hypothetical protein